MKRGAADESGQPLHEQPPVEMGVGEVVVERDDALIDAIENGPVHDTCFQFAAPILLPSPWGIKPTFMEWPVPSASAPGSINAPFFGCQNYA